VLGAGGTLTVRIVGPPVVDGFFADLFDSESRLVDRLTFTEGEARSRPVAAGSYRLVLAAPDAIGASERPVVIVAGEETTIEL